MTTVIAYNNRSLGSGAFTAGAGTWASSPSISNMGRLQPKLYAEVTPSGGAFDFDFEAQDSAGSPQNFRPDVFALIGHTLPYRAVVEFLDSSNSLGSVKVDNADNRPQNAILVTDNTTSFDTLTVSVTDAGDDTVRIGSLWASASFRPANGISQSGYSVTPDTPTPWTRVDSTIWPSQRSVVNRVSVQFPALTRAEANGPDMPCWNGIASLVGKHSPLLVIPGDDNLHEATYGLVDTFAPMTMLQMEVWRAGCDLLEMS